MKIGCMTCARLGLEWLHWLFLVRFDIIFDDDASNRCRGLSNYENTNHWIKRNKKQKNPEKRLHWIKPVSQPLRFSRCVRIEPSTGPNATQYFFFFFFISMIKTELNECSKGSLFPVLSFRSFVLSFPLKSCKIDSEHGKIPNDGDNITRLPTIH